MKRRLRSAGHAGGYILPSRYLIVNDIAIVVEGAHVPRSTGYLSLRPALNPGRRP
jgi:hypothetical protein